MRAGVVWTEARDQQLRALRDGGMTWDAIACAMALGRNTVLERARKTGVRMWRQRAPAEVVEARDRPARPAGHPQTWGMITDGTVLEGEAYPFPVFL